MGKVIMVTSGKGGVGKTTVTANLGMELARSEKKVVLLDTDFGLRNLDIIMGLEHKMLYHLGDVLSGECRMRQALIPYPYQERLWMIPAPRDSSYLPDTEGFRRLLERLKKDFDYILLDTPAGVGQLFDFLLPFVHHAIIVATSDISSVSDSSYVYERLEQFPQIQVHLLVNRIPRFVRFSRRDLSGEDVSRLLHVSLLGTIREEKNTSQLANHGELLIDHSRLAREDFGRIGDKLLYREI